MDGIRLIMLLNKMQADRTLFSNRQAQRTAQELALKIRIENLQSISTDNAAVLHHILESFEHPEGFPYQRYDMILEVVRSRKID